MQQGQDGARECARETTQPIVVGIDLSRSSDFTVVMVTDARREPLIGDAALAAFYALRSIVEEQAARRSPHPGVGRKFGGPTA